jgi:trigger factor
VELNVIKQGHSLAKVSFSVPGEEFQKEIQRGLHQARGRVRMKGFRQGKAPLTVVEKAYGEQVRLEVKQFFVRQAYQRAVEEQSLRPLAHPRLDPELLHSRNEAEAGFALDFEISLRPDVQLPEYKRLAVQSEAEPVLDEEIQSAAAEIRRQQSRPEAAGDGGIDEQSVFTCAVEFSTEGVNCFRRENLRLSLQTLPPGVDPERLKTAILGKKPGEAAEISATIPPYVEQPETRGKEGICRVEIVEVFRMVPPDDAQLYSSLGVTSETELLAKIGEKLAEAKEQRERGRIESMLLEGLVQETALEVPPPLIEEQTAARLAKLRARLKQEGLAEEKIEEAAQEQQGTARDEAIKALKALLIVEAIGERESLLVTREDLESEVAQIAELNNATTDEVRRYYSQGEMGQQLVVEILERKVRRFLRENADIQKPR